MRIAGPNDQLRGAIRLAAALGVGAIVAGCSSSGLPSLAAAACRAGSRAPTVRRTQAQASVPGTEQLDEDCPAVDIRTGAGTLAVAAKPQEPTANDLRYQLTFIELARQCFVEWPTPCGCGSACRAAPSSARPAPRRRSARRSAMRWFRRASSRRPSPPSSGAFRWSSRSGNATFTDIEEDLSFPMPPSAVAAELRRLCRLRRRRRPAASTQAPKKKAAEARRARSPALRKPARRRRGSVRSLPELTRLIAGGSSSAS